MRTSFSTSILSYSSSELHTLIISMLPLASSVLPFSLVPLHLSNIIFVATQSILYHSSSKLHALTTWLLYHSSPELHSYQFNPLSLDFWIAYSYHFKILLLIFWSAYSWLPLDSSNTHLLNWAPTSSILSYSTSELHTLCYYLTYPLSFICWIEDSYHFNLHLPSVRHSHYCHLTFPLSLILWTAYSLLSLDLPCIITHPLIPYFRCHLTTWPIFGCVFCISLLFKDLCDLSTLDWTSELSMTLHFNNLQCTNKVFSC